MIGSTEEGIAARELHFAAYHEAAHKMVYERLGGAGDAIVWQNASGNPDERVWLEQFRPRTCPDTMRTVALTSGFFFPDLPADWRVLYGIAGLVADEVLSGETDDPGAIADALRYRISNDEVSATDLTEGYH